MKWIFLAFVTAAGLHAIATDDTAFETPADHQMTVACGTDRHCIHRHHMARRTALGSRTADPVNRLMIWTPACPGFAQVSIFQACFDVDRR